MRQETSDDDVDSFFFVFGNSCNRAIATPHSVLSIPRTCIIMVPAFVTYRAIVASTKLWLANWFSYGLEDCSWFEEPDTVRVLHSQWLL